MRLAERPTSDKSRLQQRRVLRTSLRLRGSVVLAALAGSGAVVAGDHQLQLWRDPSRVMRASSATTIATSKRIKPREPLLA